MFVKYLGLKKNPVFLATRPYLSERLTLDFFLNENTFFFVGVFIIEFSILKKTTEPTLPKVFKTVVVNTRFFSALLITC